MRYDALSYFTVLCYVLLHSIMLHDQALPPRERGGPLAGAQKYYIVI